MSEEFSKNCPFGLNAWRCDYWLHTAGGIICQNPHKDPNMTFAVTEPPQQCPRGYKANPRIVKYHAASRGTHKKHTGDN